MGCDRCGRTRPRPGTPNCGAQGQHRLHGLFWRGTIDRESCQDLMQNTPVAMIGQVGNLPNADRFWSRIYRIAQARIQQHWREKQSRREASWSVLGADEQYGVSPHSQDTVLHILIHRERFRQVWYVINPLTKRRRQALWNNHSEITANKRFFAVDSIHNIRRTT